MRGSFAYFTFQSAPGENSYQQMTELHANGLETNDAPDGKAKCETHPWRNFYFRDQFKNAKF